MNFSKIFVPAMIFSFLLLASCGDSSSGSRAGGGEQNATVKAYPDSVGDIVFSDGTAVSYGVGLVLSGEQKSKAVAVIFYKEAGKMLGVGLRHDKAGRIWCDTSAQAYSRNLPGITCTATRLSDGSFSFSGDIDGSDNIDQIGLSDSYIQWRYPAFYYAINYKNEFSRVKGTRYESGWYLPSVAELYNIWKNKEIVDAAILIAGGDSFDLDNYWSSSVDGENESCASRLLFAYGTPDSSCKKYKERCVCAVREF